jgi:hypothetical protein
VCQGMLGGRNTAESTMRMLIVVAVTPVLQHPAHLVHAVEDVTIEHFGAHGVIESLDQRILRRLAWLDEASSTK